MRIGLVSDTEGDLPKLEAALRALGSHAPDLIVHAGDVLEYPFSRDPPSESVALLRAEAIRAIPGNHDRYLIDWGTPRWPHTLWMRLRRSDPPGRWLEAAPIAQAKLGPDDLAWLRSLPEELSLDDGVYLCHGMPGNPWNTIWPRSERYDANVSEQDRLASLALLEAAELVLCGHAPAPWEYRDRRPDGRELRIVRAGDREPGRVGYALLTRCPDGWQVEWGEAPFTPRDPGWSWEANLVRELELHDRPG